MCDACASIPHCTNPNLVVMPTAGAMQHVAQEAPACQQGNVTLCICVVWGTFDGHPAGAALLS
jgi:hypothetical protein